MKLHPGYEKRPNDLNFVDNITTPLTEAAATYYLKTAWNRIYGSYPDLNVLALLWAQSAGETGRWKLLRCNNWGNIKKHGDCKYTSYDAGEVLTLNGVTKQYIFHPYHPQTFFAAWDTPLDGAEAYIKFLSQKTRYKKAWIELMKGNPVTYCKELKKAGYFTANLNHYTQNVVRLTNEFKRKSKILMKWEPPTSKPLEHQLPEPEPEPEQKTEPQLPIINVPKFTPIDPIPTQGVWSFVLKLFRKLFGR